MHATATATASRHKLSSDRDRAQALGRIREQADVINRGHPPDALLTTAEVSLLTGIATATLTSWRSRGTSPIPFLKVRRQVKYELSAVLDFIDKARQPALKRAGWASFAPGWPPPKSWCGSHNPLKQNRCTHFEFVSWHLSTEKQFKEARNSAWKTDPTKMRKAHLSMDGRAFHNGSAAADPMPESIEPDTDCAGLRTGIPITWLPDRSATNRQNAPGRVEPAPESIAALGGGLSKQHDHYSACSKILHALSSAAS